MSMAMVMSEMPDLWRRVLAEHVPDGQQYCRACFHDGGRASWPCQTYRIAQEAKWVAEGGLPGTGPHGPGPSRRRMSPAEPDRQDQPGGRRGQEAPPASAYPSTGGTNMYPSTGGTTMYPSTGGTTMYPGTGSWRSPATGDPLGPASGGWSMPPATSGPIGTGVGDRPHHGDPWGAPESSSPAAAASHVTGERPYGSTFDAPYGASFGVDDRPHGRRW